MKKKMKKQWRGRQCKKSLLHGMGWSVQGWYRSRENIHPTVQILGDNFISNWSTKEQRCTLQVQKFSHLAQWTQAIRRQDIQILLPITVVSLQCVKQLECLEPLKNALASLCKAIRAVFPGGRIFITGNIPNPRLAPVLGTRTLEHNKLLFRAVTSINVQLQRVFYSDMAQHFMSNGLFIQPIRQYFTAEGDLTKTGCFVYRACLLREMGVIPYSLDG